MEDAFTHVHWRDGLWDEMCRIAASRQDGRDPFGYSSRNVNLPSTQLLPFYGSDLYHHTVVSYDGRHHVLTRLVSGRGEVSSGPLPNSLQDGFSLSHLRYDTPVGPWGAFSIRVEYTIAGVFGHDKVTLQATARDHIRFSPRVMEMGGRVFMPGDVVEASPSGSNQTFAEGPVGGSRRQYALEWVGSHPYRSNADGINVYVVEKSGQQLIGELGRGGRVGPFYFSDRGIVYVPEGVDPRTTLPPMGDGIATLDRSIKWGPSRFKGPQVVLDHHAYKPDGTPIRAGEVVSKNGKGVANMTCGGIDYLITPHNKGFVVERSPSGELATGYAYLPKGSRVEHFVATEKGQVLFSPNRLAGALVNIPHEAGSVEAVIVDMNGKFVLGVDTRDAPKLIPKAIRSVGVEPVVEPVKIPPKGGVQWRPLPDGAGIGPYAVINNRLVYFPPDGGRDMSGGELERAIRISSTISKPSPEGNPFAGRRVVMDSARGAAMNIAPQVVMDIGEHYDVMTPLAAKATNLAFVSMMTWANPLTPAHIVLSMAPYEVGRLSAMNVVGFAGEKLGADFLKTGSLGNKLAGTVGGVGAVSVTIYATGRATGAAGLDAVRAGVGIWQGAATQMTDAVVRGVMFLSNWIEAHYRALVASVKDASPELRAAASASIAWWRRVLPVIRAGLTAAGHALAPRAAAAGGLALADGPLPVGDAVGVVILISGVWTAGQAFTDAMTTAGKDRRAQR